MNRDFQKLSNSIRKWTFSYDELVENLIKKYDGGEVLDSKKGIYYAEVYLDNGITLSIDENSNTNLFIVNGRRTATTLCRVSGNIESNYELCVEYIRSPIIRFVWFYIEKICLGFKNKRTIQHNKLIISFSKVYIERDICEIVDRIIVDSGSKQEYKINLKNDSIEYLIEFKYKILRESKPGSDTLQENISAAIDKLLELRKKPIRI